MGLFDSIKAAATGVQTEYADAVKNAGVEISDFTASLQGGTLSVTGTVADSTSADKAVQALTALPGVTSVNNYLEVEDVTSKNIMLNVATEHSNLNLRQGPGTDYEVVGKAAHNSKVQLIKKMYNGWYFVRAEDGTEGFSSTDYLKEV